ncbi:MAG: YibE/F family protein [Firmicutes bacterium]|nr:YibE/F family protein [Bacillota bacterium]MBQ2041568.1 YibE/F family protein [Bacillota bacterium]
MKAVRSSDKKLIIWILTVVISAVLIIAGNRIVKGDVHILDQYDLTARAKVIELTRLEEEDLPDVNLYSQTQFFTAKLLSGSSKGQIVESNQHRDSYTDTGERFVKEGDIVILYNYAYESGGSQWVFGNFARFDYIIVLGAVFFLLILIFGRGKGVNTIISLAFTCMAVFFVFIPGVLAGRNIYLLTILICAFTIVMTLILTNGTSQKSFTTMLGCSFGVLAAAVISIISDRVMHLTGFTDEHSVYLQVMGENGTPIDLRALVFSMITIGALGAVMDVAMDIASSLYEVKRHAPAISSGELFRSGLNIGRDVMGTMANTLILAYIGSSLCSVLLKVTFAGSVMQLINTEGMIVELLNALIGSMAILLTMPLTALVCCFMYRGGGRHANN